MAFVELYPKLLSTIYAKEDDDSDTEDDEDEDDEDIEELLESYQERKSVKYFCQSYFWQNGL